MPLNLHYSKGRIKLDLGLAKGKKQYDKRATIKEREWNREQQRLLAQVGDERVARARDAAPRSARFERRGKLGVGVVAGEIEAARDATSRRARETRRARIRGAPLGDHARKRDRAASSGASRRSCASTFARERRVIERVVRAARR